MREVYRVEIIFGRPMGLLFGKFGGGVMVTSNCKIVIGRETCSDFWLDLGDLIQRQRVCEGA